MHPTFDHSKANASGKPRWDDAPWQPLAPIQEDTSCDSLVIGLGGSGLTAISELLGEGENVVGIDAADVAAAAAGRNGGFLLAGPYDFYHDAVRRHGRSKALNIYNATLEEIERISAVVPDNVRRTGSYRLAATADEIEDCKDHMREMKHDGLQVEWYDGSEGVGLFLPADASFNPLARCRSMALSVMSRGARLYGKSAVAVNNIREESSVYFVSVFSNDSTNSSPTLSSQHAPTATIRCRRIFITIDGKLEAMLPELTSRVRTARLQMLATAPAQLRTAQAPMYYRDGYEYWQQLPDGTLVIGGFRDRAGDSEWTTYASPTEKVQSMLEGFVRERLQISEPITHRWSGLTAFTNNGLPVLAETRPNIWVAGGYSGTGNLVGALSARAIVRASLKGDNSGIELLSGS